MLNKIEKERYNRQIMLPEIGEVGQQKLKSAKVLVIGAGGLGSPVLYYLAGAGVGTIGIVDGDVVTIHNLPRQILYGQKDVGKQKVNLAAERLKYLNDQIDIITYPTFLDETNIKELFNQYDIIVDCTDNFAARYLIDDTALHLNKTWVYGSILTYSGQVSVFDGSKDQSYQNLYPEEDRTLSSASNFGVLGMLPGIIGAIQANEVVKLLCNVGETLSGKLLTYDTENCSQQIFEI